MKAVMMAILVVHVGTQAAARIRPLDQNIGVAGTLYSFCDGYQDGSGNSPLCLAYLMGSLDGTVNGQVLEAMARGDRVTHPYYCPPPNLTFGTMVSLFRAEVELDPNLMTSPSAVVLAQAMRRAFPC